MAHSLAVNRAVPLFYPELGRKFGKMVTYANDPHSHAKTEFAFDVFQAAKAATPPRHTNNSSGFKWQNPCSIGAFQDTYGMTLGKVFLDVDLAVGSYRRAVGTILPAMTRVAWQIKKQEIRKDAPSATRKTFLFNLSRSSYEKQWGATYKNRVSGRKCWQLYSASCRRWARGGRCRFKRLTPEIEQMYMASFNATIARYRELLLEQTAGRLKLPNNNLDVGNVTPAGKYTLMDAAYSELLHKLQGHYTEISPELRSDILAFYSGPGLANSTKTNAGDSARVVKDLDQLRAVDLDLARTGTEVSAGVGSAPRQ